MGDIMQIAVGKSDHPVQNFSYYGLVHSFQFRVTG